MVLSNSRVWMLMCLCFGWIVGVVGLVVCGKIWVVGGLWECGVFWSGWVVVYGGWSCCGSCFVLWWGCCWGD